MGSQKRVWKRSEALSIDVSVEKSGIIEKNTFRSLRGRVNFAAKPNASY